VDRQERIEAYRRRLGDDPRSGVFVPLAELLAVDGDVDEAVTVLEAGLARHAASVPARVVLGRILLTSGRAARGRELLAEVLAADPDNLVARRLLADDCRTRGDWDQAVGHLEGLVASDPGNERWVRDLEEARRRAAGAPLPGTAGAPGFATMTMVDICIAQGYQARAAEALRRILAVEPDHAEARRRLDAIEAAAAAGGPATAGPAAPSPAGESVAERAQDDRQRRRAEQKAQFAEWIDRVRQDGEQQP